MAKMVTVIMRDCAPMAHLQEPCTYRTVHVVLTEAQELALQPRHEFEEIGQAFIEDADAALKEVR